MRSCENEEEPQHNGSAGHSVQVMVQIHPVPFGGERDGNKTDKRVSATQEDQVAHGGHCPQFWQFHAELGMHW